LEAKYVLATRDYRSKTTFDAVRAINAVPVIADNPHKKKKNCKAKPEYASYD